MYTLQWMLMNEMETETSSGGVGGTGVDTSMQDMLDGVSSELGYNKEEENDTNESGENIHSSGDDNNDDANESKSTQDDYASESEDNDNNEQTKQSSSETVTKAPNSWKPAIAEKWKDIPKEVQDEIIRREDNYHEGIKSYKAAADLGDTFHHIAKDYVQDLNTRGIRPLDAIKNFFEIDKILMHGTNDQKLDIFTRIAANAGINFDGSGNYEFQDNTIIELKNELNSLKSQLSAINNREVANTTSQLEQQVNTFASDPSNKHFATVQTIMERLIRSGDAKGLQEAYDKALWLHPDTRTELIKEQTEKEIKDRETKRLAEVNKARKLKSGNVSSSNKQSIARTSTGNMEKDMSGYYDAIVDKLN